MSNQDNGGQQPNAGADTTADQMDTDLDPKVFEGIKDDEVKKHLNTTVEQKKHWRDKAKKSQEEFETYKKANPPKTESKPEAKKNDDKFDPDAFRSEIREEMRVEKLHPDISEVEMAKAKALAKAEGKPLSEVVQDDYFQAYLKSNREKAAKENARPNPSNRGGNPSGGSIADLSDPKKVAEMDDATFARLSDEAGKKRR